ncbi:MAG: hypothetical protein N2657_01270 [bacterium]|nr:hypothetical protein [bacterium]
MSNEIEAHRLPLFRKFVIIVLSLTSITFLCIFSFTFSSFLTYKQPHFDKESKKIIFQNIKRINYESYQVEIHKYTDQEKDFYDFCSSIWSFQEIEQSKLNLTLNQKYMTIAEIQLKYRFSTKGNTETKIMFDGTIIKLKNIRTPSNLPFTKYEVREYGGETYIIIYKPNKILKFGILEKNTKKSIEQKIRKFIFTLSQIR